MQVRTKLHRAAAVLACAAALSVSACGDNGPTSPGSLAGTYVATQLLTTTNGVTTNLLAAGASITLVLNADGTTTGRLFIPASFTPAVDETLNGTWEFTNGDVDLTSSNDTVLRDLVFAVSGNALVADQTFDATRIQVVLTKQ
jgi:hypothetical protein